VVHGHRLAQAWAEPRFAERLTRLGHPKLLRIDALGALPRDTRAATCLFPLVARRDEQGSILLTRHPSSRDWGALVAGDRVIAAALLERLLPPSTTLPITGESPRRQDKRRAGLLQPLTTRPAGGATMAHPPSTGRGGQFASLTIQGSKTHRWLRPSLDLAKMLRQVLSGLGHLLSLGLELVAPDDLGQTDCQHTGLLPFELLEGFTAGLPAGPERLG
jgi:hypothetical protein